jgi:hypothetical protein
MSSAITASPGVRDQLRAAQVAAQAGKVNFTGR